MEDLVGVGGLIGDGVPVGVGGAAGVGTGWIHLHWPHYSYYFNSSIQNKHTGLYLIS